MRLTTIAAAAAALAAAGCSSPGVRATMPPAVVLSAAPQTETHSMQHWHAIAATMADQLVRKEPGLRVADLRPDDHSPFASIFSDMLAAELTTRGVQISLTPAISSISVAVRPLIHPADGETMPQAILPDGTLRPESAAPRTEISVSATLTVRGREIAVVSEILYAPEPRAWEYGALPHDAAPLTLVPNTSKTPKE